MSLPLKVKIAVRDFWEKVDSPLQKSIKEVKQVLGLDVYCEPQWPIIVSDLEKIYDDKGQLVQVVTSFVHTWFVTIAELMDDSNHDEWSEKVVGKVKDFGRSRLKVNVEVCEGERASTLWSDSLGAFVVSIPKVHVYQPVQFAQVFKEQLLDCFEKKTQQTSEPVPIHSTTGDEWDDVGIEETPEPTKKMAETKTSTAVEFLPDPNNLPKPGTLLLKPPYHLIINAFGSKKIEVQCSHAGTLDVLHEYLKRWCKLNPSLSDKPPAVEIELNQGTCGFGLTYDTLKLTCEHRYGLQFTVSPTLILHLVEGVLGYERVFSDASSWHYRRTSPLAVGDLRR
ncbi:hypothetical protein BGZ63DRAFT_493732 [Mariannaea sp. PMI_226]|nr:hypothetical protein BGZ63DRAFT_493732 [Mariannaea sp. PMI_226]